jgi:hypothetical protein
VHATCDAFPFQINKQQYHNVLLCPHACLAQFAKTLATLQEVPAAAAADIRPRLQETNGIKQH